ncbi:insulin-induced protein family, partial [Obelidium mucronatum]
VSFGLAGSLIGNVFPLVDRYLGFKPKKKSRELSAVVRLLGGVMGVNYAISRLQWMDHSQATGAITLLSLGLWFIFDRTLHGFGVSVLFALVGTAFGVVLVSHGLYTFASPDFLGIRAWFPCVLFLSAVCFGAIGRLMTDYSVHKDGKSQKKA